MNVKLKASMSLFALGLLGVLSLLIFPMPLNIPDEVLARTSESTIRIISFVQSSILLGIMVMIGHFSSKKIGLSAYLLEKYFQGELEKTEVIERLKLGILLGFITGIILSLCSGFLVEFLPPEFVELGNNTTISPLSRFLYGGITEEVLLRWGIMSFFVWLIWRITRGSKIAQPSNQTYWIGITLAALLFGLGHLPIVFNTVDQVTPALYLYIIGMNMVFGMVAGWLFWKKGLETAIIAHIFVHVGMICIEFLN